jgi:hypothetical protein
MRKSTSQVHTHIYDHLNGQSSGIEWLEKIMKIPVHVQHNLRENGHDISYSKE